jgi:hypothetical protein
MAVTVPAVTSDPEADVIPETDDAATPLSQKSGTFAVPDPLYVMQKALSVVDNQFPTLAGRHWPDVVLHSA